MSDSQHERPLTLAALAGWRRWGNMREAHVSPPPPSLARRSRTNAATKGRKHSESDTL